MFRFSFIVSLTLSFDFHVIMNGMYALQEGVRQMRGTAPAQVPNAEISMVHGVGGMFSASGNIVLTNVAGD